jgi:EAL and modified HD-GYP domain-containing signal transduction protein
MTQDDEAARRPVFITRQPILDADRRIWGYELLGEEPNDGTRETSPRQGAAALWSGAYWGLQDAMARGKRIMIALDEASILGGLPHALPPSSGVIRVVRGREAAPQILDSLEALRRDGYLVALDLEGDAPPCDRLRAQGDILAVGLSAAEPGTVPPREVGAPQARWLARGVRTMAQFQAARDAGFALFQGPFFKAIEYGPVRKIGSSEISRVSLMHLGTREEPELGALSRAIAQDVAVSFRLLTYMNSAHMGLRYRVKSIDQAVRLLGWERIRSWLRAVILVDMAGREEGPRELAALSLQRAKFLELLASRCDYWGFDPQTLFLLGLFSLLDTVLGMPMEAVVEMLPLDAGLKTTLRREPGSEHGALFRLMESLEDGDWDALKAHSRALSLDPAVIKEAFVEATDWAMGFFAEPAQAVSP